MHILTESSTYKFILFREEANLLNDMASTLLDSLTNTFTNNAKNNESALVKLEHTRTRPFRGQMEIG